MSRDSCLVRTQSGLIVPPRKKKNGAKTALDRSLCTPYVQNSCGNVSAEREYELVKAPSKSTGKPFQALSPINQQESSIIIPCLIDALCLTDLFDNRV